MRSSRSLSSRLRADPVAWASMLFLLGIISTLAWAYGGIHALALPLLQGVFLIAGGLLLGYALKNGAADRLRKAFKGWGWLALACVLFMLVQLLNPSHRFDPVMQYLNPRDHLPWLPASVDRKTTLDALAWFLTCMGGFALARSYLSVRTLPGQLLLAGLVVLASALSLLVILQRITPQPFPVYPLTGRFAYENHFAAFANLLLPISLCLGIFVQRRANELCARSHPGYILYGAGFVMIVAVAFSRSRAGMAVSFLILAGVLGYLLRGMRSRRQRNSGMQGGAMIAGVLLCLAFLAAWSAREPIFNEAKTLGGIESEVSYRGQLYGSTLKAHSSRRWTGTGAGTFARVFPFYQDPEISGHFQHAHCDPLELLVEWGICGSLLIGGLLFMMLRSARVTRPGAKRRIAVLPVGLLLALGGLLLHSLIDFPFHLPVISFSACVLAGMLEVPGVKSPAPDRTRSTGHS